MADHRIFLLLGVAFVALAAAFGIRELDLSHGAIALVAVTAAAGVHLLGRPKELAPVAGVLLLVSVALSGIGYLAEARESWSFLWVAALLVAVAAAVVRLSRGRSGSTDSETAVSWTTCMAGLLAATFATYHLFLTEPDRLGEARRLILTGGWLAIGIALYVAGSRLGQVFPRHGGVAFVCAALGKAAFYDSWHMHGGLRVLWFFGIGAVLMSVAWALTRRSAGTGATGGGEAPGDPPAEAGVSELPAAVPEAARTAAGAGVQPPRMRRARRHLHIQTA